MGAAIRIPFGNCASSNIHKKGTVIIMTKKTVIADSGILLCGADGVADSRILSGFRSMIEAEAVTRARNAGYAVSEEYCHSGEFGIDIIGETALGGATLIDGKYFSDAARQILSCNAELALTLDVNGAPRRAAACCGLVNIKPTYGTVSRYGILPVASSADTVTVTARTVADCRKMLSVISGSDEKDATTVSDLLCPLKNVSCGKPIRRIGISSATLKQIDEEVATDLAIFRDWVCKAGVEIVEIPPEEATVFNIAHAAWNTVLCAEAWGNLSRYDGVRYGKRASEYSSLAEMYERTRSEGFGELIKNAVLYGSYALSPECEGGFFKAKEAREWIKERLGKLFCLVDGLVLPACSATVYTPENMQKRGFTAFNENFYTSLASLCGLPAITVHGFQIVGNTFSDLALLDFAENVESLDTVNFKF